MSVTDDAVQRIRDLIITGRLRPGDQLPQEAALADELGISRNSMREAVRALQQMRVLDVRHGSGTYVSSLEPAQLLEGIAVAVEMLQDDTVREVIEVRVLLEPAATRLAAERMTPEKLQRIREAYEASLGVEAIDDLVRCDLAFHREITAAADNTTLSTILEGLSGRTVRFRTWGGVVSNDAVTATIDLHRQILAALESGDPQLAEAAALLHVSNARKWYDAGDDARLDAAPGAPEPSGPTTRKSRAAP